MFNFQEFKQWFNTQFTTERAKIQAGGSAYKQTLIALETPSNWEKACQFDNVEAQEEIQCRVVGYAMIKTISWWNWVKLKQAIEELKAKLVEY